MNWYLNVLRNYAVFSGRTRRKEFWMFLLFNLIFSIAASIIDNVLGTTFTIFGNEADFGPVYILYCIALFIPELAVNVRRLHDVGKSGWWILICFVPIIGSVWLLVLFCTEGNAGDNAYGSDPKAE
ncbi:MAG: DUF805 domain-containing protein [Rikenellaceae bacterium]|jgi:uncharacterized membrane protein YhaH (DUF805 family)|nr:DUF805 domain-containing protein [Rikenellaceae bacterium]